MQGGFHGGPDHGTRPDGGAAEFGGGRRRGRRRGRGGGRGGRGPEGRRDRGCGWLGGGPRSGTRRGAGAQGSRCEESADEGEFGADTEEAEEPADTAEAFEQSSPIDIDEGPYDYTGASGTAVWSPNKDIRMVLYGGNTYTIQAVNGPDYAMYGYLFQFD